ncbi:ATP-binding protein [Otariodibacter oris]|uniref:AAA ATPase-like protein n=1 Tax=Otariodibacter oris TaxID=1032623 RepID=A0A420XII0_9PAST|nr:ATP-binding protein [Otariodibacter oris]QGM80874.1 ATP/GTP-binding protein [Otariodibacter oris]RKR76951.1 AAA ATPase-like protein [Otariodibacter oris]
MKISYIKIKNFRGYEKEIVVNFDNLTAIVGKNDVGKSTILEALDIFFNNGKGIIKIDKNDVNKKAVESGDFETIITVCFDDLPEKIIIDSSVETTLKDEYLLNSQEKLEIIKKYKNGGSHKVYLKAKHPNNPKCSDLLLKKNTELKKLMQDEDISNADFNINSSMRKGLWQKYLNDLQLEDIEIDVTKEDARKIWDKLAIYLPVYSLFQSDRKNSDNDNEVQDPLKEAVKQIVNDESLQTSLAEIADIVRNKIEEVSSRTLQKIREMDPEIANTLNPIIPSSEDLKWQDVFKNVSISGDENIPINKRGSGVRRLILLNFFRAEAERRAENNENANVIYAIEEPETSQHTSNQHKLIKALKELSNQDKTQILLTTHSSNIVKQLDFENLRLLKNTNEDKKIINVSPKQLNYPSLNEVNYLAFEEITEEYHNELYGHIELQGWLQEYRANKSKMSYHKQNRDGSPVNPDGPQKICLTDYIRHQIHHPENNLNTRFTPNQLKESIEQMRIYISEKKKNKGES